MGASVVARASDESDYAATVDRARALAHLAQLGDAPSVHQAAQTLREGTGGSQPEVLKALEKNPPDPAEAEGRLLALADALRTRADTPDPPRASQELRRILAEPRYRELRAGQSLPALIGGWILRALSALLDLLSGAGISIPSDVVIRVVQGMAFGLLVGVVVWLVRAAWHRGRRDITLRSAGARSALAPDRFAEADQAAREGDYGRAIRSLTLGVAAALAGGQRWEFSPYTVRETFSRAPEPDRLRELLVPFEAAAYGHRPIDAPTYARAAAVAAPFRAARQ